MGTLFSFIAGLASGETAAALRQAKLAAIAYVLAGVAGLCGVGFLIGALHIFLSRRYGTLETTIGFGVGFVVLALLVLLIFRLGAGSRRKQRRRRRNADMTALGATAALAALPALLRSRAGPGLVLGPAFALVAYAIYRENAGAGRDASYADTELGGDRRP